MPHPSFNELLSRLAGASLLVIAGCGSSESGDDDGPDATATDSSTSSSVNVTTTSSTVGDTTEAVPDEDSSSGDGTTGMSGVGENGECDLYAQDCMEGLKCVPRLEEGQRVSVCVMATGTATPGDPCTHEGVLSGVDSCDEQGMCFGELNLTGGPWEGQCRRFCGGTPETAECESLEEQCAGGLFPVCLPRCDPLVQDCSGAGEGCYFRGAIDSFVCLVSSSSSGAGDNCETTTSCGPGLQCRQGDTVEGCTSGNCCAEFCDTEEVGACDGATTGAECVALGAVEPQFVNVGVCGIPQ